MPLGVVISTKSPLLFPINPFPIGDLKKINFFLRSASSLPTILYSISSPVSKFFKDTVEPNMTLPSLLRFVTSIKFAVAILFSIS